MHSNFNLHLPLTNRTSINIKMEEIKVIEVDYAIANRFGNEIEINKNLKKPQYKVLYKQVLTHELKHDNDNTFIKDFAIDMEVGQTNLWLLFKFMLNNPKSFIQFVPIYKTKSRGWSYDSNLLIFYVLLFIFIATIIYISYKFL